MRCACHADRWDVQCPTAATHECACVHQSSQSNLTRIHSFCGGGGRGVWISVVCLVIHADIACAAPSPLQSNPETSSGSGNHSQLRLPSLAELNQVSITLVCTLSGFLWQELRLQEGVQERYHSITEHQAPHTALRLLLLLQKRDRNLRGRYGSVTVIAAGMHCRRHHGLLLYTTVRRDQQSFGKMAMCWGCSPRKNATEGSCTGSANVSWQHQHTPKPCKSTRAPQYNTPKQQSAN